MTWTYDVTTDRGKVRLLYGDTNSAQEGLSDAEVDYLLTLDTDLRLVAARCCDVMVGKLARDVDRSNLGMSATRSQQVQHYRDLAETLRREAGNSFTSVTSSMALTESDVDSLLEDTDARQPVFAVDMDDYPGATRG